MSNKLLAASFIAFVALIWFGTTRICPECEQEEKPHLEGFFARQPYNVSWGCANYTIAWEEQLQKQGIDNYRAVGCNLTDSSICHQWMLVSFNSDTRQPMPSGTYNLTWINKEGKWQKIKTQ